MKTLPPLNQIQPEASAVTTSSVASTAAGVARSHPPARTRRAHTRRSFHATSTTSIAPATSWATNTQASSPAPANSDSTPVTKRSPTSAARPQSVPRGVTAPRVYAGPDVVSAAQRARHFDDLLERGPVLEREWRDRDPAGDREAVLVEAARLRVRLARARLAVEVRPADAEGVGQRRQQRRPAGRQRPVAAVHARVAAAHGRRVRLPADLALRSALGRRLR